MNENTSFTWIRFIKEEEYAWKCYELGRIILVARDINLIQIEFKGKGILSWIINNSSLQEAGSRHCSNGVTRCICGSLPVGLVSGWARSSKLTSQGQCTQKSFLVPVLSECVSCIALVWLGSHAPFELISVVQRKPLMSGWVWVTAAPSSGRVRVLPEPQAPRGWGEWDLPEMQPLLIYGKEYVLGRQKQHMSITFGHSKIRFWFAIKNAVFI